MKKYKAAVVGCGRIGVAMEADPKRILPATHAGAFRASGETTLTAFVDPDPKQLKYAADLFPETRGFDDCKEMLQTIRPDIVSVSTPPSTHRKMVELCASFKVPAIICEKPIAETEVEAKKIIAACRKSGSLLFINHMRR